MYEDITPESIKAEIKKSITTLDTREGSFVDLLIGPVAYEIWKYYTALNAVIPIAFPDETSGKYLEQRASDYGIYRKMGTKARCSMTLFGAAGTMIPGGKNFLTSEGIQFVLTDGGTIPSSGSITIFADAAEVGSSYNIGINTLNTQSTPLYGLTSWTNTEALGGTDPETDESLAERLYAHLQRPATSGNAYQYEQWALEVDGVGKCKIYPLWNGAGTVKLVITGSNGSAASTDVVENVKEYVEEVRPIGATVTVVSAVEKTLAVSATVSLTGSRTVLEVQNDFSKALEAYFESIALKESQVSYNKIAYLLLSLEGVKDFTSLTLNGGTDSVNLSEGEIPRKGEISVDGVN